VSEKLQDAIDSIRAKTSFVPLVGAVLGSGLGYLADHIDRELSIPYGDIAHFPQPSVKGHSGELVLGTIEGVPIAMLSGRVHLYEGLTPEEVVFPIRVLRLLGAKVGLLTNASGGINPAFDPGDLMLLKDHINAMGVNPLVGPNRDEWGPRFPDMTYPYDRDLQALAKEVATDLGIPLRSGVYISVMGPSYETPAEIRMFKMWGADAVGMSTVPEVIAARHMGMRTLAISCVANPAAGIHPGELSHEEVTAAVSEKKEMFGRLVRHIIAAIGKEDENAAAT
jgi:purine-nucleoside phosphorylase